MNTSIQNIIPFKFNANEVRTILINSDPWFVAQDISNALGYAEASDMTRVLDSDEKGRHTMPTLKGNQEMLIINESGLYHALFKSRKAEAMAFRKWVTTEVLPSIRKTGSYATPTNDASTDLFLNTSHARTQARKAGLTFYDARQAILKQINTPAAQALGLPPATEQIAEGVIADMFMCGRFLVGFDINHRLQINQLHPNDIVINPNNLVSTILHGVIKPHDFPSILGAIANVLETKTHQRITK